MKAPTPIQADRKTLAEEADRRIADARRAKADVEQDIREAYYFTNPRLSRTIRSTTKPDTRIDDSDTLWTTLGTEVSEDFATEIINAFMPPHYDWARSQPTETVPDEAWKSVKEEVEAQDRTIFKAIRASNFDAELGTALVPDAAIGTVGIWIDDPGGGQPIRCQHVPLRELELAVGPHGAVDECRAVVRWVRYSRLNAVLPDVEIPKQVRDKHARDQSGWCEVRWVFWRDWSEPMDTVWQQVVQIDGIVVEDRVYRGDGACPLIVARFAPDALYPFGNGPTIGALPYLRVLDTLAQATQEFADIGMGPPFAYPDDGILNFEGGIKKNHAYPKRPGARGEIEPLFFQGSPDIGIFTLQDLERSIRRKHFVDFPEQRGDTPPTATQWIDEMVKAQRRLGTPGQKFWREGPAEVFQRFRYLLEAKGTIRAPEAEGVPISLAPYNPAAKAQEHQELQVAASLLEMAKSFFPMTSQVAIDEYDTIQNLKDKAGDKIVTLRERQAAEKLVQQMLQVGAQAMQQQGGEAA